MSLCGTLDVVSPVCAVQAMSVISVRARDVSHRNSRTDRTTGTVGITQRPCQGCGGGVGAVKIVLPHKRELDFEGTEGPYFHFFVCVYFLKTLQRRIMRHTFSDFG